MRGLPVDGQASPAKAPPPLLRRLFTFAEPAVASRGNVFVAEVLYAASRDRAIEHATASYRDIVPKAEFASEDLILAGYGAQFKGKRKAQGPDAGENAFVFVTETQHVTEGWVADIAGLAESLQMKVHVIPTEPKPDAAIISYVRQKTGHTFHSSSRALIVLVILAFPSSLVGSYLLGWFKRTGHSEVSSVSQPVAARVPPSPTPDTTPPSKSGVKALEPQTPPPTPRNLSAFSAILPDRLNAHLKSALALEAGPRQYQDAHLVLAPTAEPIIRTYNNGTGHCTIHAGISVGDRQLLPSNSFMSDGSGSSPELAMTSACEHSVDKMVQALREQ